MDIYLVGGAVRDQLLGLPNREKDWVVVGGTPAIMLAQGFRSVGKDFPVFLHPQTQEEYALARTERKTAPGYSGFQFDTAQTVTLEQDLYRRDLTINAMAMTDSGEVIDPYNGRQDLQDKVLRHVSEHFSEDPVRLLRVARFKARYHHLGFTIADETLSLMKRIVDNGEVDALVPERVWKEMSRALGEPHPEQFVITLKRCGALRHILPEVDALYGVPQPPQHHPEIDCGIHTELVLQQASRLSDKISVRFASMMHDLGKATTPADVLPRHVGHEQRSGPLIKALCQRLAVPNDFRDLALLVAQYHTHCHRVLELKPSTLLRTLEALDGFRRPDRFDDFLLCCEADARGRTGLEDRDYPQVGYFHEALRIAEAVNAADIDRRRFQGEGFGEELHRLRLQALTTWRANQNNNTSQ